jgi:hypothetical protein
VVSLVLKTLDESEAVRQAEAATAQHEAPTPAPDAAEPKQAVLTDRPPAVTILSPPPGAQLSGDSAELQVEVHSQAGRPVKSIEARLNDQPAPGVETSEAQATPGAQGETVETRRIVVPVAAGQTATLQVIARSGDLASEAATLEVKGRMAPPEPAATPPVAGLSTLAPVRVVLNVARDDVAHARRAADIRQALAAAGLEVADRVPVDAHRTGPSIGYYFQSDRNAAAEVSHVLEPLLGAVAPVAIRKRASIPEPGTIEIAVP